MCDTYIERYHLLFIHSSVDGCSGCFHNLALVDHNLAIVEAQWFQHVQIQWVIHSLHLNMADHSLHLKTLSSFGFCNLNSSGFFFFPPSCPLLHQSLLNPSLIDLLILECSSLVLTLLSFSLYIPYLVPWLQVLTIYSDDSQTYISSPNLNSETRFTNSTAFLTSECPMGISNLTWPQPNSELHPLIPLFQWFSPFQ